MAAIPVAPPSDAILVAAPAYLAARSIPSRPRDLLKYRAVMCRSQITGLIKPWLLRGFDGTVEISPPAATIVHDLASQIDLAVRGLGILSAPATSVSDHLGAGRLTRILPA